MMHPELLVLNIPLKVLVHSYPSLKDHVRLVPPPRQTMIFIRLPTYRSLNPTHWPY